MSAVRWSLWCCASVCCGLRAESISITYLSPLLLFVIFTISTNNIIVFHHCSGFIYMFYVLLCMLCQLGYQSILLIIADFVCLFVLLFPFGLIKVLNSKFVLNYSFLLMNLLCCEVEIFT